MKIYFQQPPLMQRAVKDRIRNFLHKKTPAYYAGASYSFLLAEREGFEPPEPRSSTVFKTAAIDHSAISPGAKVEHFFGLTKYFYIFFKIFFSRYFLSNHKILIISKKYDVFFGLLKKCLIFVLHIITK